MIEKLEFEGKNVEEAIQNCLSTLNLKNDDIIIINNEEKSSLFKGKKCTINIIKKEDIKNYIKNFFKDLSKYMNISINCEILEKDDTFSVTLISDNNAILIGKEGKNLEAIQILVRSIVKKIANNKIRINIDASNYKAKKIDNLTREIDKIAKEVINSKVDVKLDPMNSYERMIVHNHISKYEELVTESIGEEPERYIVIKYKENYIKSVFKIYRNCWNKNNGGTFGNG